MVDLDGVVVVEGHLPGFDETAFASAPRREGDGDEVGVRDMVGDVVVVIFFLVQD